MISIRYDLKFLILKTIMLVGSGVSVFKIVIINRPLFCRIALNSLVLSLKIANLVDSWRWGFNISWLTTPKWWNPTEYADFKLLYYLLLNLATSKVVNFKSLVFSSGAINLVASGMSGFKIALLFKMLKSRCLLDIWF